MNSLVSVVIPSFNNAQYIEETLTSILNQTYKNIEVIVSDHSSSDETQQILKKFTHDQRLKIYTLPQGGGAPRNWNYVSQLATGDFIKLVCGDDVLFPEIIELQLQAFDRYPSANMVSSPREIVDGSNRILFKSRGFRGKPHFMSGHKALKKSVRAGTNIFGEPACVTFRRDSLRDANWWSDDAQYLLDQTTYSNVLLSGDYAVVPKTLAKFRVSASQWSYRLAKSQSTQVRHFHHELRRANPKILSRLDVLIGNSLANANALARRVIYLLIKS